MSGPAWRHSEQTILAQAEDDMRNWKLELDEPKCVAAGQCVMAVPEVFDRHDEDGIAILLDTHPGEERHAGVGDAAAICPAAAIRLVEQ